MLFRSQFVSAGDRLYLWRLNGVELRGDQLGQAMAFKGDLDPAAVTAWIAAVRKLALNPEVRASRVVGKFGLGYALYRMATPTLGVDVSAAVDSSTDFFLERLYEVIFSGPEALLPLLKKAQGTAGGDVVELGQVKAGHFKLGSQTFELSNLHRAYNDGWRKHFAELA